MKKILLISSLLIALILFVMPVNADNTGRQAVVYYNEACDECAIYINGELQEILQANQVEMVRKDYINQRENRKELNQKNDSLGVPLELQSHLVTFIDEGRIILQGEPPRHVVEDLLSTQNLPVRILIYSEEGEGDGYKAWAYSGPVQSYGPNEPITTYLTWFEANQASFENTTIVGTKKQAASGCSVDWAYRRDQPLRDGDSALFHHIFVYNPKKASSHSSHGACLYCLRLHRLLSSRVGVTSCDLPCAGSLVGSIGSSSADPYLE